jgi:hypothetical protein
MREARIAGTFVDPVAVAEEQRDSVRAHAALPLQALLLDEPGAPIVPITCCDTSTHGMGFTCARAFHLHQRFVVHFHFANGHDRLVLCQVRHCAARAAQGYQGGVEFLHAVTVRSGIHKIPDDWVHDELGPSNTKAEPSQDVNPDFAPSRQPALQTLGSRLFDAPA